MIKLRWKRVWLQFYKRWLIPLMIRIARGWLRLVMMSCRVEIEGAERFIALAARERCILMLWHNRIALVAPILSRTAPQYSYVAFVSNSRDGELVTAVAKSYKQAKVLRVPHNAKHQALRELIKQLKSSKEIILFTPDGPRGPKYQVKPGIVLAAKSAEAQIIPFTWSASRFWQLNTWDQLIVPKPFSKIAVTIGEPISINEASEIANGHETILLSEKLKHLDRLSCQKVTTKESKWPK